MGDHCYVMLNGLMDAHLVYCSIPYIPWKMSKASIYTFFTFFQCQMLRDQACNWD